MATKNKSINLSKIHTLIIGLIFGLAGGWIITSTFAAPQPSSMSATLNVSPNPVSSGQTYTITGCGYANKPVNLVVSDGTRFGTGVWADGGCINGTWKAGNAGTFTMDAYQEGKGKKQIKMATTSFTVTQ